jgi:hypothetical protein
MKKRDCRVTLACGCVVLSRDAPINDHIRYPCPSNMGHGYTLPWTSWCLGDVDRINPSEPSSRSESTRRPLFGAEPVDFEDVKPGDHLSFGAYSAALRRYVWREGVVTGIARNSVSVDCPDGTRARLNRDRWSIRGVSRLP